jgi:hypothetical protein
MVWTPTKTTLATAACCDTKRHPHSVLRCSLSQHIFNSNVQVASYAQRIENPIRGQEAGHPVIRNMHPISALIHEDGDRSIRAGVRNTLRHFFSPMRTCHRHYPGRWDGACSLVSLRRRRPSLCNSQVGSCDCFFEACSAFTHVMACTLAESPCDPLHRRLRQLRCLRCRFDCYRVERTSSRAGVAPAEVQRLFTAHCHASYESRNQR